MAALFSISLGKNFPGLTVRIHRKTKELTPPRPSAVFLFHPRLALKNNPTEPGSSKEQTNDASIISRGILTLTHSLADSKNSGKVRTPIRDHLLRSAHRVSYAVWL